MVRKRGKVMRVGGDFKELVKAIQREYEKKNIELSDPQTTDYIAREVKKKKKNSDGIFEDLW